MAYRPPSTFASGYMAQPHGMGATSTYNPLCSQPRPYGLFSAPLFEDAKAPRPGFQPINGRLDFSPFGLSQAPNPYSSAVQRDTNEYDI